MIGLPVVLLGEAIRVWSSGSIHKDSRLATQGPYAFSRNPLYVGSFLLGFGVAVMSARLSLVVLYIVGFYSLYKVTVEVEEKRLVERYGETYRAYCLTVPRWISFPRSPIRVEGKFEWKKVIDHREHNTWFGILGIIGLLIAKGWLL